MQLLYVFPKAELNESFFIYRNVFRDKLKVQVFKQDIRTM